MQGLSKTDINLWTAFMDEGKAHHMYVAYAMKAMEEGHPEVAQVFMEVAGAETIHGVSHLRLTGSINDSLSNLRRVVEEEGYETATTYPRMIREAEAEGREDAVASFRLAMEREAYHQRVFQEALDRLEHKLARQGGPPQPAARPAAIAAHQADAAQVATALAAAAEVTATRLETARQEVLHEKERIANLTRLREIMFGMQDGLVSTVALVNSVAAATGRNDYVIIAGMTGALAGVFSMAAGSYLGSRAEQDVQASEIEKEAREIAQNPAEELAELIQLYRLEGYAEDEAAKMAQRVAADRELWLKVMAEKELGLSPDVETSPWKDSAVMGASFFVGGLIPVASFFFLSVAVAPVVATVATLLALFLLGLGKGRVLKRRPLRSALEVVTVGTLSAVLGTLLGDVLPKLLGVSLGG
ncbi:MAG: VIT1/CCC1 transporter family protein [Chloroflexi bacterium]|nr:VIT1/CCC1 transporter family protein [Chloroflexota bacterium]